MQIKNSNLSWRYQECFGWGSNQSPITESSACKHRHQLFYISRYSLNPMPNAQVIHKSLKILIEKKSTISTPIDSLGTPGKLAPSLAPPFTDWCQVAVVACIESVTLFEKFNPTLEKSSQAMSSHQRCVIHNGRPNVSWNPWLWERIWWWSW